MRMTRQIEALGILVVLLLALYHTRATFLLRPENVTVNPNESFAISCVINGDLLPVWKLGNGSRIVTSKTVNIANLYANGSVTSVLNATLTRSVNGSCCISDDECAHFMVHINEAPSTDISPVDDYDDVTSGANSSMPPNEDSPRESYYAFVAVLGVPVLIGVILTAFCLWRQHIRKQYDIERKPNKADSAKVKSANEVELFGPTEEKAVVSSTAESTVKQRTMPRHVAVDRVAETTLQDHSNQRPCLESTPETVASYPETALDLYEVCLQPADDGADESPRGTAQEQPAGIGQSRPVFTPPDSKPTDQQSTVVSHDFIG